MWRFKPLAGWALRLLLVALGAPGVAPAQNLAAIPVEAAAQVAPPVASTLRVRVHVTDAAGVARLLDLPGPSLTSTSTLDVSLRPGLNAQLQADGEPLAPSFLVDHDEPDVQRLHQQLRAAHMGQAIGGAQIVAFVSERMHGDYASNADLASEVARSLRGDCTEYSLLTAALARAQGIPARIVWGAALQFVDGRWRAYGHAWVEMREAGAWVLRDSALAKQPEPVYYLPTWVMTDEGPGYQFGMLETAGRLPRRLEVLGSGDGAGKP
jgi:Transglutaminase-like superfamily